MILSINNGIRVKGFFLFLTGHQTQAYAKRATAALRADMIARLGAWI